MRLRVYIFATIYARVSEKKSFAQIVSSIRGEKGISLVSVDDINRRIVARVSRDKYSRVLLLLEEAASSIMYEVKAVAKSRQCRDIISFLREGDGLRVIRLLSLDSKRVFYLVFCNNGEKSATTRLSLYIEATRGKCLFKVCRKPATILPREVADMPPSLCTFSLDEGLSADTLFSFIQLCLNKIISKAS